MHVMTTATGTTVLVAIPPGEIGIEGDIRWLAFETGRLASTAGTGYVELLEKALPPEDGRRRRAFRSTQERHGELWNAITVPDPPDPPEWNPVRWCPVLTVHPPPEEPPDEVLFDRSARDTTKVSA